MREKFLRFMAGRYGADQLSRFLSFAALVLIVLNLIFRSSVLWVLALVLLVLVYVRMFSKNFERRRMENETFLRWKYKLTGGVRNWLDRQKPGLRLFPLPGLPRHAPGAPGQGKDPCHLPQMRQRL